MMLQQALNGLNNQGATIPTSRKTRHWPGTVAALKAYLAKRVGQGEQVLLKALNCLQGARYIEMARGAFSNEDFVYGWLANRVAL
jgi:lysozyme family protein